MIILQTVLLALHVISAALWLSILPAQMVLGKSIAKAGKSGSTKDLASSLVSFIGFAGNVGGNGVLITGIAMVLHTSYYGFFDFSGNHWLASKQILMVFLLGIVAFVVIPVSKKIRAKISASVHVSLEDDTIVLLSKLMTWTKISAVLVILNFLFAFSRRITG